MEGYKIDRIFSNVDIIDYQEKAILVGNDEESVSELARLAETAGVKIEGKLIHRKDKINASYYIGTGKLKELDILKEHLDVNVIIFDNDLTPAQFKNLEEKLDVKIIDRTQLILDIFALHARSKESKIQVELAQLEYMLPKLKGQGINLSRLGAGIGTRGPGETKLEVDRRRIESKISRLKNKLNEIKKNRKIQRVKRTDPLVALIGYTNAGKSTLMNLLTDADTIAVDQLFATLDLQYGKPIYLLENK
ncbi:MAG: GTPase HflX [bacterium]